MLDTLLIALGVIGGTAAFIFFFVLIGRRQQRRRSQQLQDSYHRLLQEHRLQPDHVQVFTHRMLGFDASAGKLAFVQQDPEQPSAVILLQDVDDCRLWKDGLKVSRRNGDRGSVSEEYISAIGLSFIHRSGAVTTLPLYTEALDGMGEKITLCKAAEQWLDRMKTAIAAYDRQQTMRA